MHIELTIAGLCLLAHDETEDTVLVLMPATGYHIPEGDGHEHAGHARLHEPHFARLVYPSSSPHGSHEITGFSFDLGTLVVPSAPKLTIPADVFDIRRMGNNEGTVDRVIVTTKAPALIASMLTLRGGTLSPRGTECCLVNGTEHVAAGHTVWRAEIFDGPTVLEGMKADDITHAKRLQPHSDGEVLRLGLVHSTADDMPTTLDELHTMYSSNFDHFTAFYPLVKRSGNDIPTACEIRGPSQCMPAQARVG